MDMDMIEKQIDASILLYERLMQMKNFEDRFIVIESNEKEEYESKWGNRYVGITFDDIAALLSGKVLYYNDGEYSTFVKAVKDKYCK